MNLVDGVFLVGFRPRIDRLQLGRRTRLPLAFGDSAGISAGSARLGPVTAEFSGRCWAAGSPGRAEPSPRPRFGWLVSASRRLSLLLRVTGRCSSSCARF